MQPKPKKEGPMSLDEAIDDSENLTDFLLDFEEEWHASLRSVPSQAVYCSSRHACCVVDWMRGFGVSIPCQFLLGIATTDGVALEWDSECWFIGL